MNKTIMLEQLINHYTDGNKSKFANMLGIKPQTINTWLTRNTLDAELIYSKCEDVSGGWLLSGEGDMLEEDKELNTVKVSGKHNQVNGSGAHDNINGNATENAVLQERVKSLESLLAEKERLIKVYEKMTAK